MKKKLLFPVLVFSWCILAEITSPGHSFYLFSFILYIPFFYALKYFEKHWLIVTFLFGMLYNIIYFRWLIFPFQYTNMPVIGAVATLLAMALALTMFLILFSFIYVKIFKFEYLIGTAALFTALEITKGIIFTGLPWGDLSYNFAFNNNLIQIASIGGSYFITFFIFLVNLLLFQTVYNKKKKTAITLTILIIFFIIANQALLHIKKCSGEIVNIAVIQGNIPEKMKLNEKNGKKILQTYINETTKILKQNPNLIVWPESIYIKFLNEDDVMRQNLVDFLGIAKTPLILGIPTIDFINQNKFKIYNSLYMFISPKKYLRYDKVHLVPFGEYTPLKSLFFFVNKIVPGEDFSKGKQLKTLNYKSFKVIPLICFEGIFPFQIMQLSRKGGNILINISNEAWFGKSYALKQHLAANVLRATESEKYFIRCANTGISAVISPSGEIINYLKPFTKGAIVEKIQLCNKVSFYHRTGYMLNFLYFFLPLFVIIRHRLIENRS